jgi:hypothetical protein
MSTDAPKMVTMFGASLQTQISPCFCHAPAQLFAMASSLDGICAVMTLCAELARMLVGDALRQD